MAKTKEEFTSWLQEQFDAEGAGDEFDAGDIFRDLDSGESDLPEGVKMVMDHTGHDIIFKLEDGMLASGFETGLEDETIVFYSNGRVEDNMRDYSSKDLDRAIGHARVSVWDLEGLLSGG